MVRQDRTITVQIDCLAQLCFTGTPTHSIKFITLLFVRVQIEVKQILWFYEHYQIMNQSH